MPKLTLNASRHVIEKAKRIAERQGISVSAMFGQFVETLSAPRERRRKPAPITRSLRGLAKVSGKQSDRELFEQAILAKGRR